MKGFFGVPELTSLRSRRFGNGFDQIDRRACQRGPAGGPTAPTLTEIKWAIASPAQRDNFLRVLQHINSLDPAAVLALFENNIAELSDAQASLIILMKEYAEGQPNANAELHDAIKASVRLILQAQAQAPAAPPIQPPTQTPTPPEEPSLLQLLYSRVGLEPETGNPTSGDGIPAARDSIARSLEQVRFTMDDVQSFLGSDNMVLRAGALAVIRDQMPSQIRGMEPVEYLVGMYQGETDLKVRLLIGRTFLNVYGIPGAEAYRDLLATEKQQYLTKLDTQAQYVSRAVPIKLAETNVQRMAATKKVKVSMTVGDITKAADVRASLGKNIIRLVKILGAIAREEAKVQKLLTAATSQPEATVVTKTAADAVATFREGITQLKESMAALAENKNQLTAQLKEAKEEEGLVTTELSEIEESLRVNQEQIEAREAELTSSLTASIESLGQTIQAKQIDFDAVTGDSQTAERTRNRLSVSMTSLSRQKGVLQAALETLTERDAALIILHEEKAQYEGLLADANEQLEGVRRNIQDLGQMIEAKNADVATTKKRAVALAKTITEERDLELGYAEELAGLLEEIKPLLPKTRSRKKA